MPEYFRTVCVLCGLPVNRIYFDGYPQLLSNTYRWPKSKLRWPAFKLEEDTR